MGGRGQTHRCEQDGKGNFRVELGRGWGETGFRRGEGGDVESHFLKFRHVLGPPHVLLLYPHPAGHFPQVWFHLQLLRKKTEGWRVREELVLCLICSDDSVMDFFFSYCFIKDFRYKETIAISVM